MSDDRTKLLAACVDYRAMLDKLEAENAALRADKARLDWLEERGCWLTIPGSKNYLCSDEARGLIDLAMGEGKQ